MLDFKPQIVHFCGHGAGDKGLILEDESGKIKPVSTPALAALFEMFSPHVECVLLNACYSEKQAAAIAPSRLWFETDAVQQSGGQSDETGVPPLSAIGDNNAASIPCRTSELTEQSLLRQSISNLLAS